MQLNVLAIFINKMTAFSAELAVHSRKGLPETQGNKGQTRKYHHRKT